MTNIKLNVDRVSIICLIFSKLNSFYINYIAKSKIQAKDPSVIIESIFNTFTFKD